MATTKATGTITCFELFPPPPSAETLKREREMREAGLVFDPTDGGDRPEMHAVVIPDDGGPQVLCNIKGYMRSPGLSAGDKVSYMVEGTSAKFGTEIKKIS